MTTTESVWAEFHRELLAFIQRRVTDPEVARDLLQDVFVKVHLKLPTLTQSDKLASWVYQITRNRIIDHLKGRKAALMSDGEPTHEDDVATDLNPEFLPCLIPFLARLEAPYREALLRTELGSLSQKEYAAELGISYSGTKSRVQRAKQQLHVLFTDCCQVAADAYGNVLDFAPKAGCTC